MTRVKVCGITNIKDATRALELGADAIGLIFAQSPRQITIETAREIVEEINPFVKTVGVFVDEGIEKIKEIISYTGIDLVQFHGSETPALCNALHPRAIKVFRINEEEDLKNIHLFKGKVRSILLDTYKKGIKGGTGETFDWDLAAKAKDTGIPVILSGGLGPNNIKEAIAHVKPFAVDVNSGVEQSPGIKNHECLKQFMDAVQATGA